MGRLAVFLISLCLTLPALASDAAQPTRKQVYADVTVHYSAFSASMLVPEVAAQTGLIRSRNQGVLSLSVLKAGKAQMAVIGGKVKDLTGRSNPLSFRQVTEGGAVSYVAQFKVEQPETLVFDLDIEVGGINHTLSFNQEMFPGE